MPLLMTGAENEGLMTGAENEGRSRLWNLREGGGGGREGHKLNVHHNLKHEHTCT